MPKPSDDLIVELVVVFGERSITHAVGGKSKFVWWWGLRCSARHYKESGKWLEREAQEKCDKKKATETQAR